jgi:fluoroacetyl-CoA thioesterase
MLNQSFTQSITVTENQTAEKVGSGGLPVFSTPSLIALMENTAMRMFHELTSDLTTVGAEINIKHLKASKIGSIITCTATCTEIENRKYIFHLEAKNEQDDVVGQGTHIRFVVNIDKFMSKLD